jgi:hypothetical protein
MDLGFISNILAMIMDESWDGLRSIRQDADPGSVALAQILQGRRKVVQRGE